MIRFLAGLFLMARLVFQRLDVNLELCLQLWRKQAPIVEVMQGIPASKKQALIARLDLLFPPVPMPELTGGSQVYIQIQGQKSLSYCANPGQECRAIRL